MFENGKKDQVLEDEQDLVDVFVFS